MQGNGVRRAGPGRAFPQAPESAKAASPWQGHARQRGSNMARSSSTEWQIASAPARSCSPGAAAPE